MTKSFKNVTLTTKTVAFTALATALTTVSTVFGFSSPQFYFNLGDTIIMISSVLLGPFAGLIAGGFGSFFADLAVYPATMFFTLIIKGIEGFTVGILYDVIRKKVKNLKLEIVFTILSMVLGGSIMMVGYFISQTFFYGTLASAVIALPLDALQAVSAVILSSVILYALKAIKLKNKLLSQNHVKQHDTCSEKENSINKDKN